LKGDHEKNISHNRRKGVKKDMWERRESEKERENREGLKEGREKRKSKGGKRKK